MGISLLPALLWGTFLCLILHSSRRRTHPGISEDSAHELALERRRKLSLENSRTLQRPIHRRAIASILGGGEDYIDCQILKITRACLQIAVPLPIPLGEQINVAWENEFFVGAVNYSGVQRGQHVVGLQLISSNQE